jgi:hypothetical protein
MTVHRHPTLILFHRNGRSAVYIVVPVLELPSPSTTSCWGVRTIPARFDHPRGAYEPPVEAEPRPTLLLMATDFSTNACRTLAGKTLGTSVGFFLLALIFDAAIAACAAGTRRKLDAKTAGATTAITRAMRVVWEVVVVRRPAAVVAAPSRCPDLVLLTARIVSLLIHFVWIGNPVNRLPGYWGPRQWDGLHHGDARTESTRNASLASSLTLT